LGQSSFVEVVLVLVVGHHQCFFSVYDVCHHHHVKNLKKTYDYSRFSEASHNNAGGSVVTIEKPPKYISKIRHH
jgi:hypothetical protein